jgi:hypothetical protein
MDGVGILVSGFLRHLELSTPPSNRKPQALGRKRTDALAYMAAIAASVISIAAFATASIRSVCPLPILARRSVSLFTTSRGGIALVAATVAGPMELSALAPTTSCNSFAASVTPASTARSKTHLLRWILTRSETFLHRLASSANSSAKKRSRFKSPAST